MHHVRDTIPFAPRHSYNGNSAYSSDSQALESLTFATSTAGAVRCTAYGQNLLYALCQHYVCTCALRHTGQASTVAHLVGGEHEVGGLRGDPDVPVARRVEGVARAAEPGFPAAGWASQI